MSYPYIIQGSNITVVIDNVPHTINQAHLGYEKIKTAIKANDWATVKDNIEPRKAVIKYGNGDITIGGDVFSWRGKVLANALSTKIVSMLQEGFDIDPFVKFMDNLMANPSNRAVTELYGFLEKGNLPITPDGHFLAYKKVRSNYFDVHSGTFDNSVGKICEMARNEVDDNKDRTCSTGLHFCSQSYLSSFGGERTVILKINPKDVVSIPSDYNDSKGRTCRYEVIGELTVDPDKAFTKAVQETAVGSQPVKKPEPKKPAAPKTGSSAFYRGYEAGFTSSYINRDAYDQMTPADKAAYGEGYEKGADDALDDADPRYVFVPSVTTATTVSTCGGKCGNNCSKKAPVQPPRSGSTAFYQGYSKGYAGDLKSIDWMATQTDAVVAAYTQGYTKGSADRTVGNPARYLYVQTGAWPVAATTPVQQPRIGATAFYRGYSRGYVGEVERIVWLDYQDDAKITAYEQGYAKGVADRTAGNAARYAYPAGMGTDELVTAVTCGGNCSNVPTAWPAPVAQPINASTFEQGYDAGYQYKSCNLTSTEAKLGYDLGKIERKNGLQRRKV